MNNLYSNVASWDHVRGLRGAMDTVIRHTAVDRQEYAVVLSPDGSKLREYQGDDHHVMLDELVTNNIVVHSHPLPSPLSPEDIMLATVNKSTMYAIGTDDSIYCSTGFNKWTTQPKDVKYFAHLLQSRTITAIQFGIDEMSANIASQHLTWIELSQQGHVDYHYTLGPVASAAVDRFKSAIESKGVAFDSLFK